MKKLFVSTFIVALAVFAIAGLFPNYSEAAGLVPCGGCQTELDPVTGECPFGQEQQECNLCHGVELGNRLITFFLAPSPFNAGFAFVPLLIGLLVAVAGFMFLAGSFGNPALLQKARTILFISIIGFLIIYGTWAGINTVFGFFGVTTWQGIGNWWEVPCGNVVTVVLDASPRTVFVGDSTTLLWDVLGVTSCVASGGWSGVRDATPGSETNTPPLVLGTITYTLECSGLGGVLSSSVQVDVVHRAPVVNAGPGVSVELPASGPITVSMAGTASDDGFPLPASLTTNWTIVVQPAGSTMNILSPTSVTSDVEFFDVGTYELMLTADDTDLQSTHNVIIVVEPFNSPPIARAGSDKTVILPGGTTLNGSASGDDGIPNPPGAITASWVQIRGPTATILNSTEFLASVTFPEADIYEFELTVNDNLLQDTDTVVITVDVLPPSVALSSSASTITDGDSLTLTWMVADATSCQTIGDWPAPGSIAAADGSEFIVSVTPDGPKTYTLQCTNSVGVTRSDSVGVAVTACPGGNQTCYQRPIAVDNPGGARTNYQVKIVLNTSALISAGKMRSDCGDLRVTDTDGITLIPHWLENGCNSPATNIWIKAPSLPGGAITTLNAHYGNPGLATANDFAGTFPSRYILAAGSDTSAGPQNYDWFEVRSGTNFFITDGIPQNINARKILITGVIDGGGPITFGENGRGFAGANSNGVDGAGPGGAIRGNAAGGGYGGAGGDNGTGDGGGGTYGNSTSQTIQMGSGGANSDNIQQPAGDGGGAVTFNAQEIEISGTVDMSGGFRLTGTNENGGGSGGGILILSSRVNLSGTLWAQGGRGDPGSNRPNGAGGGGGGRIKIFRDESIDDTSDKFVDGGIGSPGGGPPGQPGTAGTTHTGTFTSLEPTTTVGPEI